MNIEQAASRLRDLENLSKAVRTAIEKTENQNNRLEVRAFVKDSHIELVGMSRDQCIEVMRATLNAYQAEISRLQPIVDMANLALKGLFV